MDQEKLEQLSELVKEFQKALGIAKAFADEHALQFSFPDSVYPAVSYAGKGTSDNYGWEDDEDDDEAEKREQGEWVTSSSNC